MANQGQFGHSLHISKKCKVEAGTCGGSCAHEGSTLNDVAGDSDLSSVGSCIQEVLTLVYFEQRAELCSKASDSIAFGRTYPCDVRREQPAAAGQFYPST